MIHTGIPKHISLSGIVLGPVYVWRECEGINAGTPPDCCFGVNLFIGLGIQCDSLNNRINIGSEQRGKSSFATEVTVLVCGRQSCNLTWMNVTLWAAHG